MSDLPPPDPPEPESDEFLTRGRIAVVVVFVIAGVGLLAATGALPVAFDGGGDDTEEGLTIAAVDIDDETLAGEQLSVEVMVENTDVETVTDTLTVEIDDLGTESLEIAVPAGETDTRLITFETTEDDSGEYTAVVTTGDGSVDAGTEVVPAEPTFEITNVDVPADVDAGDVLTVGYSVENTGTVSASQTVVFTVEDTAVADEQHTLDSGETASGEFTYEVDSADGSTLAVEVASEDDTATATVDVAETEEAQFEVTTIEATAVTAGDDLTVTTDVENTGTGAGSQTVTVDAGALGTTSAEVPLQPGESATETFTFETTAADAGEYTVTAETEHDQLEATVAVEETDDEPAPPESSLSTLDIAGQGEAATVEAPAAGDIAVDVENVGEESGSFNVTLSVGDAVEETEATTNLSEGETESVAFENVLDGLEPGNYSVTVTTDDDTVNGTVVVDEPESALFEIQSIQADPDSMEPGEAVTLSAEIENVGAVEGTQDVTLLILTSSPIGHQEQLTLVSGETGSFTHTTEIDERGTHSYVFETEDDEMEESITVQEEAFFAVDIVETNTPVEEGETLEVVAEITNTGGQSTAQSITLNVPGLGSSTEQVALSGGESEEVTLTVATEDGDGGTYTATVESDDDQDSTSVAIGGESDLQLASVTAPVEIPEDEDLEVEYVVENVGGGVGTESSVILQIDGVGPADSDSDVTVEAGGSESGTLFFTGVGDLFEPGDTIQFTVELSESGDSASGSTDVTEAGGSGTGLHLFEGMAPDDTVLQ